MSNGDFASVRVVGGLLPPDLLARVLAGDKDLGGLTSGEYHLPAGESPREAANRAWTYLLGAWSSFKQALAKLPEGDPAVGLTREKWLTILFKELDFGRLPTTPPGGIVLDDKAFPVSHLWEATPIHLLGWGVELDKRTKGVPGAAERAPQAMVQELLNRTDDYLWAMLSNGRTLRLLRDSTSLAGQAYVEFDLETMFDGELFSDFVLLYLLLHQSRVEVPTDGTPRDCWLEKWRTSAAESGTRALGLLRDGVKDAIEALGTGFLQAPGNDLNTRIADGQLSLEDYHRALLRLVYRLLFLFVTEDRGLLLDPKADKQAAQRYRDYYSTNRLRTISRERRGSRHTDLWDGLQLVIDALGRDGGQPQLAIPGLGGIFDHQPIDVVMGQRLPNEALLTAIRKLSVVHPKGQPPRIVDYRNLGAEELGSIYESLLELVPRHDHLERTFTLELLAGNDRKTSGSYYTPSSLIDLVLDEALDPLLDEREKEKDPEQALLSMTVCDPACGSGHFLVAAARRIATRLAAVRTGETDPTPTDIQAALHDVVARCIYGVDLNPMAAELAKVSLWLEAMQPGRPLSFLDAHIKVGNALLGTTPRLLADGIPDAAFDPLEGDDRKYASALKKRNKAEREKQSSGEQGDLFGGDVLDTSNAHLRSAYEQALAGALGTTSLADVHEAERRYRQAHDSPAGQAARLRADTWCAAFVQRQVPGAPVITQAALDDPSPEVQTEVRRLAASFRFFHWHLEFPEVFDATGQHYEHFDTDTGLSGGFTVMVGNPPFLNQLNSATALQAGGAALLRAVSNGVVKALTDLSAVFLALGTRLTTSGGRIGMVQPQSLLAARDASAVRAYVAGRSSLLALWASSAPVFQGTPVLTCAVIVEVSAEQGFVRRYDGPAFTPVASVEVSTELLVGSEWSVLIRAALGIPQTHMAGKRSVGDLALCTADFRDQYYGLVPFVVESEAGMADEDFPPLITTGLIDPAACLWGTATTRFNKTKWEAPRVDLVRMKVADPKLAKWAAARLVPKILIGTQGKVIEAMVDERGAFLPCVPVITVQPKAVDPWMIAAVLLSPVLSAFAAGQFAGAGLATSAIKLSAKQVAELPIPDSIDGLSEAARYVQLAQSSADDAKRLERLREFARLTEGATGSSSEVTEWWWSRLAGDRGRRE